MGQFVELLRRGKLPQPSETGKFDRPCVPQTGNPAHGICCLPMKLIGYSMRWVLRCYGARDRALLLVPSHGSRVGEAITLRWEWVHFKGVHVKNSIPSTRPLRGYELRALRHLGREWPDSRYLLASEHGSLRDATDGVGR
jgi:integrase